ncbi:lysis system o-spanin lipoprotein Rz1 [Escherichia coli]
MVVGCSSKENALCHPQPKPPAPPAWAMMPPSNCSPHEIPPSELNN